MKIKKLVFLFLAFALLAVTVLPTGVYAQDWPDVDARYFTSTGAYRMYDLNNNRVAIYRGLGFAFTDQDDGVVTGEVDIYTASSVRGTAIASGTGTINRVRIHEGLNYVTVTATGTHTITLPVGVAATAISDTATVTGSPLDLPEDGVRDIPTSGTGIFNLYVYRTYTTIGTFTGAVGEGRRPRFQLVGTQVYATATEGTATVTGSPVKCLPASSELDVTGAGTITIDVPYGMVGEAVSGTATVTNSPVTLPAGEETEITTGVTTGTVTINLRVAVGYNISGYIALDRNGDPAYMRGRIDGFIVTDPETLAIYQFNAPFRARYTPGD